MRVFLNDGFGAFIGQPLFEPWTSTVYTSGKFQIGDVDENGTLDLIVRAYPSEPDAHYHLGRVFRAMGREEEARKKFREVQELSAQRKVRDELKLQQLLHRNPAPETQDNHEPPR